MHSPALFWDYLNIKIVYSVLFLLVFWFHINKINHKIHRY